MMDALDEKAVGAVLREILNEEIEEAEQCQAMHGEVRYYGGENDRDLFDRFSSDLRAAGFVVSRVA